MTHAHLLTCVCERAGEQGEKYAEECSALEEELEKLLTRAEENKRKAQQVANEVQRLEDELAQLGHAQEDASQQTNQMNERFRQLTDEITTAQSVEVERKTDRQRYALSFQAVNYSGLFLAAIEHLMCTAPCG
jgi:predicted nuclease with TOPRIM domain